MLKVLDSVSPTMTSPLSKNLNIFVYTWIFVSLPPTSRFSQPTPFAHAIPTQKLLTILFSLKSPQETPFLLLNCRHCSVEIAKLSC